MAISLKEQRRRQHRKQQEDRWWRCCVELHSDMPWFMRQRGLEETVDPPDDRYEELRLAWPDLSPRERQVLSGWSQGMTLEEIGRTIGRTGARARQCILRGFRSLRGAVERVRARNGLPSPEEVEKVMSFVPAPLPVNVPVPYMGFIRYPMPKKGLNQYWDPSTKSWYWAEPSPARHW